MTQPPEIDTEENEGELRVGSIVAEQYRVLSFVGRGSRTSVYTVRLEPVGEVRALKVLSAEFAQESEKRSRFEQEIQTALKVKHPHLLDAVERVEIESRPGLVMEYADGGTLKNLLLEQAPVELDLAIRLTGQLCSALSALHEAGVIHRDLKPRNIFLTLQGEVRLGEFGLAVLPGQARSGPVGQVVGAIEYVSPEYLQTGRIDERADCYAVGLLLYQLVTGHYPYEREENPVDSLMKRLTGEPIPLEKFCPNCPPEVAEVVMRALAHDPEQRYASALEFAEALAGCLPVVARAQLVPSIEEKPVPEPMSSRTWRKTTTLALDDAEFPEPFTIVNELEESRTRKFVHLLAFLVFLLICAGAAADIALQSQGLNWSQLLPFLEQDKETLDGKNEPPPAEGNAVTYIVVKGDTAEKIARKFEVSSAELLTHNKISDPRRLIPGQVIEIPPRY